MAAERGVLSEGQLCELLVVDRLQLRECLAAFPLSGREVVLTAPLNEEMVRALKVGDVVLAYLRIQAHTLRTLEPRVRADEYDAVHQMRVATRRLRAALRTFGQVIPRTDSEHLAAELREVAS